MPINSAPPIVFKKLNISTATFRVIKGFIIGHVYYL